VEQVYLPFRYRQPVTKLAQGPASSRGDPTHSPPTQQ